MALSLTLVGSGIVVGYVLSLVVYRLLFSPVANFPGPKLAALSNWYEFYYDVIQQGQFTAHIQDLHKQYGSSDPNSYHADLPRRRLAPRL